MKKSIIISPTSSNERIKATAEVIKLGIDIHKDNYVVVRQVDQQAPQSLQRFSPAKFLVWGRQKGTAPYLGPIENQTFFRDAQIAKDTPYGFDHPVSAFVSVIVHSQYNLSALLWNRL
jgi:hypothetical protein